MLKLVKERSKILNYVNDIMKVGVGFERLFFFIMLFLMVSHIVSCLWVLAASINESHTGTWLHNMTGQHDLEIYLTSIYFTVQTITTVGYGDYAGSTPDEYIFSIALEFMGLTFFSFLMGSINGIFNTSDNFDDLIEEKLDSLDMWIKKIEKSNKPFHIQPTLYNDIRKYVEQAFLYDFNLVIEEFQFYQ